MEIYLKMTPKPLIDKDQELNLNYFAVSQACGYSFNSFSQCSSKTIEESKSTFGSQDSIRERILENMIQAYEGHRIDEAYKYRQQYIKNLQETGSPIQEKYSGLLQTIKQEMEDVLEYEKELNPNGWVHKKNGKYYKLFTKHFDETVAVLVEADLQIPIEKFIFIINEFDLMKQFMPFMQTSRQVKEISRNCKIGHIVNDFPILSKREAFFQGIGYDRMEHNNTILLYSRSLHNRKDLQEKLGYKVETNSNAVQLEYKFFVVQYEPIDRNKGKIKIAMNVDMKISAPKFILDPVTQNFGKDFLKNVLHVTNNFQGSQWEKRAVQKTQFTNFIRSTINKYFPQ